MIPVFAIGMAAADLSFGSWRARLRACL